MGDDARRLRVGVLGCGPIARAAHLQSCSKARNATLHAICDGAPDLVERMRAMHRPTRAFTDYDGMLADPDLQAVVVATADADHVEHAVGHSRPASTSCARSRSRRASRRRSDCARP